jgi:alpha-L-arabinofuranosidase
VLRWPGGCFADEYHWKDGIGPREKRPSMINTHWGGVVENNHFGTHEFLDLCEQLGCRAYICGNVGSGTVQEMMEWVEYMTSDAAPRWPTCAGRTAARQAVEAAYFGVGNESWGCGGNMRPSTTPTSTGATTPSSKTTTGNRIYRIACGANGATTTGPRC